MMFKIKSANLAIEKTRRMQMQMSPLPTLHHGRIWSGVHSAAVIHKLGNGGSAVRLRQSYPGEGQFSNDISLQ